MVEATLWHPVAAARDLGSRPLAVALLERRLVLWRDADGFARAFDDRCPHRGTPLSMGRLADGRLECAYHGWQFAADGRCARIPALPEFAPPAAHAVRVYETAERYGMVWTRLEPADRALPEIGAAPPREVVTGPYDVATSAPRVVENFLDMSHFPFVHEGGLGDRAHAEVPHHEVQAGSEGRPVVPAYRAWQPRASEDAAGGAWVDYRYEVLGPYTAVLHKIAARADAPSEAYALWVCPSMPETSRVWFTQFTSDAAAPEASLRAFQDGIFAEDRPIVEAQVPKRLPLAGEAHCAADRASVAYRRYLRALGVTFGVTA